MTCSGAENGGSGHGGSGFLFGTRVGEIKGRKSRKSRGCCCEHRAMDGSVATEFRSSNRRSEGTEQLHKKYRTLENVPILKCFDCLNLIFFKKYLGYSSCLVGLTFFLLHYSTEYLLLASTCAHLYSCSRCCQGHCGSRRSRSAGRARSVFAGLAPYQRGRIGEFGAMAHRRQKQCTR